MPSWRTFRSYLNSVWETGQTWEHHVKNRLERKKQPTKSKRRTGETKIKEQDENEIKEGKLDGITSRSRYWKLFHKIKLHSLTSEVLAAVTTNSIIFWCVTPRVFTDVSEVHVTAEMLASFRRTFPCIPGDSIVHIALNSCCQLHVRHSTCSNHFHVPHFLTLRTS
jgi:hypothetical protein